MSQQGKKEDYVQGNMFEEVTVSSQSIFQGKIISLQVDTVKLPDGSEATREIVRHPGAVAVLAIHEGKMVVVEQFRKPLNKSEIEIPAGKLDPGESPETAAMRELKEETGYTADSLIPLGSYYTSPGFADEIIYIYAAENLQQGEMQLDEDEFLQVTELTLEEAYEAMRQGRIHDAKTIHALYAWHLRILTGKWPV